jgi:autotransporter passenger strand-loop-strand repeat protein
LTPPDLAKGIPRPERRPCQDHPAGKGFLLTYTNLDTGNSVTIRTDGSVSKTTVNPDGTQTVSAAGHNGLILFPTDVPAGPTTTHYIGRIIYNVDPATGVFTLVSTTGSRRDICAELSTRTIIYPDPQHDPGYEAFTSHPTGWRKSSVD